jgi:hypothetical protein
MKKTLLFLLIASQLHAVNNIGELTSYEVRNISQSFDQIITGLCGLAYTEGKASVETVRTSASFTLNGKRTDPVEFLAPLHTRLQEVSYFVLLQEIDLDDLSYTVMIKSGESIMYFYFTQGLYLTLEKVKAFN